MNADKETTIEVPHSSTILCNPIAEHALEAIVRASGSNFSTFIEWSWWCRDIACAATANDAEKVKQLAAKIGYIAEGL